MNAQNHPGRSITTEFTFWLLAAALGMALLLAQPLPAGAQSSLAIRFVPVVVPELRLTAPLGTTNALQTSTNLTTWQDIGEIIFTNTTMTVVDQYPRGYTAYYRLRQIAGNGGGVLPPFPAPTNMVWVPPGTYVIGSSDANAPSSEQPQTSVTLTKGFFVGKYEVTEASYQAVTGGPSTPSTDPIASINWRAATNYCRLLTIQTAPPSGYSYRLPTEVEWETAARAGVTNRFNWGDDPTFSQLGSYAWFLSNAGSTSHPVGQKSPNSWGLYDFSGNVSEWCLDYLGGNLPGGSVTDLVGSLASGTKAIRGGAFDDEGDPCRPAARRDLSQSLALDTIGFRVVLAQAP